MQLSLLLDDNFLELDEALADELVDEGSGLFDGHEAHLNDIFLLQESLDLK